ncbi:hypothetical protein MRB53_004222 [Persea americana]|nr:hypothetical protein MRB53_004222 [Persea americana]
MHRSQNPCAEPSPLPLSRSSPSSSSQAPISPSSIIPSHHPRLFPCGRPHLSHDHLHHPPPRRPSLHHPSFPLIIFVSSLAADPISSTIISIFLPDLDADLRLPVQPSP